MPTLDLKLINDAGEFLADRVRQTPVEFSPELSRITGVPVTLKLEFLQITGSFKLRGAMFRISRLTEEERATGIATCSAGNHGKAVAYAARELGLRATIYVPRNVDESKYRGMIDLGGEVIRSEFFGYDETESWAMEQAKAARKTFISAFDDYAIMAANGGTLAAEVLDQVPDARSFILPVGGGGLSAGFSYYARQRLTGCEIIGAQHELCPALRASLERGRPVTKMPHVETLAAGLEGGIGEKCFGILRERIDRVALVSETEILTAFRWILEKHQYLVEPSSAVPIAACLSGKAGKLDEPTAIVLTGRNVSAHVIAEILKEADET